MLNINIREEIFGATINVVELGKREYITKDELEKFMKEGIFPKDSFLSNLNGNFNVKMTRLSGNEVNNKFSFADIAFIEITRKCNLRCKHCLNSSGLELDDNLSDEEIKKLIVQLSNAGIQEIRFTGGEPLTHNSIYDFISLATNNGIYVSIGTNGTLITENIAKKLKKAGLKKAVLSLDGTKERHDFIRGLGNFDKTFKAIDYLKENNIDVKVNSVIMKNNIEEVIELAKIMNDNKTDFFIRRFIESGRGSLLEGNTLTFNDYLYVNERLKYLLDKDKYVRGHYIRLSDNSKNTRINIPFNIKLSCKVGQRALVILPNGLIHFCGFLAAQNFPPIGNVREINDFKFFWDNLDYEDKLSNLNNSLEKYNQIKNVQPTNCLAYAQAYINNTKKGEI